jgi:hypothetical protein
LSLIFRKPADGRVEPGHELKMMSRCIIVMARRRASQGASEEAGEERHDMLIAAHIDESELVIAELDVFDRRPVLGRWNCP